MYWEHHDCNGNKHKVCGHRTTCTTNITPALLANRKIVMTNLGVICIRVKCKKKAPKKTPMNNNLSRADTRPLSRHLGARQQEECLASAYLPLSVLPFSSISRGNQKRKTEWRMEFPIHTQNTCNT